MPVSRIIRTTEAEQMTMQTFLNELFGADTLLSSGVGIILKTLFITLVALLAIRLLRHSSAALRHLVCVSAIVAMLLVPMGQFLLPSWDLLPPLANRVDVQSTAVRSSSDKDELPSTASHESDSKLANPGGSQHHPLIGLEANNKLMQQPSAWPLPSAGSVLAIAWAIPALFFLFNIFRGMFLLRVSAARSRKCQDRRIHQFVEETAALLGTNAPKVYIENKTSLPMVWGVVSGQLHLPNDVHQWPDEKLRDVVLHELAHLSRKDPLTLLLGQLARAVYWFNPLAWSLNRQLVLEQEVACDDLVLRFSNNRTAYASTLLEMTAIQQPALAGSPITAAMAKPLQIEKRIRYLLDENQNRVPVKSVPAILTLALFLGTGGFLSCLSASPATVAERIVFDQEPDEAEPNENLLAAVEFLQNTQDENDHFADEEFMNDGTNALGALALTHVGEVADKENQARAIRLVAGQDVNSTYELSLQLIAPLPIT